MAMEGLVVRTTGSWYRVLAQAGTTVDCRLRGNYRLRGNKQTNPVAVGDRVVFDMQDDGTGVIGEVADRRNYIVRRATKLSKQTHVIAANIDLLCVVATLGLPRTSTGFIDRLLVTAEAYHIPACVVFNKSDLLSDPELHAAQASMAAIYRHAGYPVLEVSALTGMGLDTLKAAIAGKTVLFSGHSGVGKSALLNAIEPGLGLKVGQISDWSLKGKHTTTFAEIFPFADGYLIDTHTACGRSAAKAFGADNGPTVVLSTASPYKFPAAVLSAIHVPCDGDEFEMMDALETYTKIPMPENLRGLRERPVLHRDVVAPADMLAYVKAKKAEPSWP